MCTGIALSRGEIPESLIERYELTQRIVRRTTTGSDEFHFLWGEKAPVLPVWHEGQFQILPWGNRSRNIGLPVSGVCPREALDAGLWNHCRPVKAFIPATFGLDRGIWYQVREGLQGIIVVGRDQVLRVYILTEPATHYYEIMTKNHREPVMIGDRI